MEAFLYKELYELEATHFWHVGKRKNIFSMLDKYRMPNLSGQKVIDIGCGAGLMLKCLERYGTTIGVDLSMQALEFCGKRGSTKLCQADAASLPFKDNSFDLITSLDLIEHLEGDKKALTEFLRILKPEGFLVLTVPAFHFAWSYWDEVHHHKRRYTVKKLSAILADIGFSERKTTYTNILIFFPALIVRKIKQKRSRNNVMMSSDFLMLPLGLNAFFKWLYQVESAILKRVNFPFGLSILCITQKNMAKKDEF